MAIFALTFPAIGTLLVFGSIWSMKVLKHEQKLKQDFPEQPWRWKTFWSTDSIPDTSQTWQRPLDLYTRWSAIIVVPLILTTAMIATIVCPIAKSLIPNGRANQVADRTRFDWLPISSSDDMVVCACKFNSKGSRHGTTA